MNVRIFSVKSEPALKLLQKQAAEGLFKVGSSVPIAPLKPMKPQLENLKEIAEVKIEAVPISMPAKDMPSLTIDPKPQVAKPENASSALLYTVETQDGFRFSSTSLGELWNKVFDSVQSARLAHNMNPLPANALSAINNIQLLGLKSNGLKYLIEQLPGAHKCVKYKPVFHTASSFDDGEDDVSTINHSFGCVKFMPHVRKKEPNDMFGWLASKHRKVENSLIDSELLPR